MSSCKGAAQPVLPSTICTHAATFRNCCPTVSRAPELSPAPLSAAGLMQAAQAAFAENQVSHCAALPLPQAATKAVTWAWEHALCLSTFV